MKSAIVTPDFQHAALGTLMRAIQSHDGFSEPEIVDFEDPAKELRAASPDFIVVVLQEGHEQETLELLAKLHRPDLGALYLVGPARDPKLILRALHIGADLYLDEDDLEGELATALARLQKTRPIVEAAVGNLTAVLSTAGGCGASTLAINLAAILAKSRGRCNLIDLNPGKPDLAPLLDLKPQYTLTDVCRNFDRLDKSMYENMLVRDPGGIALLAGPKAFEEISYVSSRAVGHAIGFARAAFAEVIVDLHDCFHEEQMLVLQQATRILLVCRLDFASVRNSRRILDYLLARQIPKERIEFVVNHVGLPSELMLTEAETAIGAELRHFVPHAPEVVLAANNAGIPAARSAPDSMVVQCMARVVGLDSPAPPSAGSLEKAKNWYRGRAMPWIQSRAGKLFPGSAAPLLRMVGGESS